MVPTYTSLPKNAFALNHPLGDFVAALPALAIRPVSPALRERIEQIQAEIRKVEFELPDDFDMVGGMARRICFDNARNFFGLAL